MTNENLAKEWEERFTKVWDPNGEGQYRMGSCGLRLLDTFLENVNPGDVINDYGSGTGRAAAALIKRGFTVHCVDIAPNAMEEECRTLIEAKANGSTFTLGPLWDLPADFPVADWGYCTDVLMCVPPEKLGEILHEIHWTCRAVYIEVYDWQDRRLGMDMTTVMGDAQWWFNRLSLYWGNVKTMPCKEHGRRYLFICKDGHGS